MSADTAADVSGSGRGLLSAAPRWLQFPRFRSARRTDPLGGWALALAFMAPALVLMTLFKLWPIQTAAVASVSEFNPIGAKVGYAGLDNFARGFHDERFLAGLWLTLGAALVKVPVQIALGIAAALLLRSQTSLNKLARAIVVSPVFLGLPVTSLLFAYLFDSNVGLVNAALGKAGIPDVAWFSSPHPAQAVLLLLSIWRDLGLTMLVFLAGLAAIPRELIAAARLDGAGSLAILATIVWPLLRRSVQFAVVLATLASFQLVVPVLILTQGGPLGATDLASYQVYQQSFEYFDYGQASAMSLVLVVGLFAVIALELRWLRTEWTYGS